MNRKEFEEVIKSRKYLFFSVGRVSYNGAGHVVSVECKKLLKDRKLKDRIYKLYNGGVKC